MPFPTARGSFVAVLFALAVLLAGSSRAAGEVTRGPRPTWIAPALAWNASEASSGSARGSSTTSRVRRVTSRAGVESEGARRAAGPPRRRRHRARSVVRRAEPGVRRTDRAARAARAPARARRVAVDARGRRARREHDDDGGLAARRPGGGGGLDAGRVPAATGRGRRARLVKVVLLVAMLAELGIHADPALVDTDREERVAGELPGPNAFEHVVAQIVLDGRRRPGGDEGRRAEPRAAACASSRAAGRRRTTFPPQIGRHLDGAEPRRAADRRRARVVRRAPREPDALLRRRRMTLARGRGRGMPRP